MIKTFLFTNTHFCGATIDLSNRLNKLGEHINLNILPLTEDKTEIEFKIKTKTIETIYSITIYIFPSFKKGKKLLNIESVKSTYYNKSNWKREVFTSLYSITDYGTSLKLVTRQKVILK